VNTSTPARDLLSLLQEQQLNPLVLVTFDKDVFNAIEGKEHMYLREKEGTYYTMKVGDEPAGVIGFSMSKGCPFLQIGIIKKFRKKGLFEKGIKALAKKHRFKKIYSDMEKTNKVSITAHEKFGFRPLKSSEEVERKHYSTDTRLVKEF